MNISGLTAAHLGATHGINSRWQENIGLYLFWAKCLNEIYGLLLKFRFSLDFDRTGDVQNSEIHLAKLLTRVERLDEMGKPVDDKAPFRRGERVVATFDMGLQLEYKPSDNGQVKSGAFSVSNFHLNYIGADAQTAQNALIERIKAAFLIVQASDAAGFKEIDITSITDPIENFIMKKVCEALDMNCGGYDVDISALPINPEILKDSKGKPEQIVAQKIMGGINDMSSNIFAGVTTKVEQPPKDEFDMNSLLGGASPQPASS